MYLSPILPTRLNRQMLANVTHQESLRRRKIEEVDTRTAFLYVPLKHPFLPIWAPEGSLVAVLIQSRCALSGGIITISQTMNVEVWSVPGFTVPL
jgi:hypothetical protein